MASFDSLILMHVLFGLGIGAAFGYVAAYYIGMPSGAALKAANREGAVAQHKADQLYLASRGYGKFKLDKTDGKVRFNLK